MNVSSCAGATPRVPCRSCLIASLHLRYSCQHPKPEVLQRKIAMDRTPAGVQQAIEVCRETAAHPASSGVSRYLRTFRPAAKIAASHTLRAAAVVAPSWHRQLKRRSASPGHSGSTVRDNSTYLCKRNPNQGAEDTNTLADRPEARAIRRHVRALERAGRDNRWARHESARASFR